jgi:hypothetical protein
MQRQSSVEFNKMTSLEEEEEKEETKKKTKLWCSYTLEIE